MAVDLQEREPPASGFTKKRHHDFSLPPDLVSAPLTLVIGNELGPVYKETVLVAVLSAAAEGDGRRLFPIARKEVFVECGVLARRHGEGDLHGYLASSLCRKFSM